MNAYIRKSTFLLCGIALLFLVVRHTAHATTTAQPPYTAEDIALVINLIRAYVHVPTLATDSSLTLAAEQKAHDMTSKHYFNHQSPRGVSYTRFIDKTGYVFQSAGENLAVQYPTLIELFQSWIQSSEHLQNIIQPTYTEMGIGIEEGTYRGHSTWYVVGLFASPK